MPCAPKKRIKYAQYISTEKQHRECMCVDVSSCEWSEKDGDNANFA